MDGRAPGEGSLRVRVVSVGRDRSRLFTPAVNEYAGRLLHYVKLELVELAEAPPTRSAALAKSHEARRILSRVSQKDWLVALDERGEAMSSLELSQYLGRAQSQSRDLLFAIGGDEGLDEQVLAAAQRRLSLSRFTLPHRLARLVLLEQLYRGFALLRGEPYAK